MRHRLATPVALVAAVAVFAGGYALTRSLLWPPLLAAAAALGAHLMLDDRSAARAGSDDYGQQAREKVDAAVSALGRIERLSGGIRDPQARTALQTAARTVPELFDRVRETSPNSLYSTASQLGGHVASLDAVVRRYLDIQDKPLHYSDPQALLRGGEEAFRRFADFVLDSVRLVNVGDIARYRANLDTVAPPKLPEL